MYDRAGNRIAKQDDGQVTRLRYDRANQLTRETGPEGITRYTYDEAGNQLLKETPDGDTFMSFDGASQIVLVEPPAGPVELTYNALYQRVRKVNASSEVTKFIYDGKRLQFETGDDDLTTKRYTSATQGPGGEYGGLIGEFDDSDLSDSYPSYDAQWSATELIDENGDVQDRLRRTAFGLGIPDPAVAAATQPAGSTGSYSPDTSSGYTLGGFGLQVGYYRDQETDLYLLGAGGQGRYYDPATGRFITQDPIGDAGGDENLYRYVSNNPINRVDSSGNKPDDELISYSELSIYAQETLRKHLLPGWDDRHAKLTIAYFQRLKEADRNFEPVPKSFNVFLVSHTRAEWDEILEVPTNQRHEKASRRRREDFAQLEEGQLWREQQRRLKEQKSKAKQTPKAEGSDSMMDSAYFVGGLFEGFFWEGPKGILDEIKAFATTVKDAEAMWMAHTFCDEATLMELDCSKKLAKFQKFLDSPLGKILVKDFEKVQNEYWRGGDIEQIEFDPVTAELINEANEVVTEFLKNLTPYQKGQIAGALIFDFAFAVAFTKASTALNATVDTAALTGVAATRLTAVLKKLKVEDASKLAHEMIQRLQKKFSKSEAPNGSDLNGPNVNQSNPKPDFNDLSPDQQAAQRALELERIANKAKQNSNIQNVDGTGQSGRPKAKDRASVPEGKNSSQTKPNSVQSDSSPKPEIVAPKVIGVGDIPTYKSGKFEKWFDELTPDELANAWEVRKVQEKIKRQLLGPGGEHEYLMRATAPQWKKWGVTARELREKYSVAISELNQKAKGWIHTTGPGTPATNSKRVHNQLQKIVNESSSLDDFRSRLVPWANQWLKGGVSDLPNALQ